MRNYNEILKQKKVKKVKKVNKNKVPYGWCVLKLNGNKIEQYNNYTPESFKNMDEKYEMYRQRDLYYKNLDRLIRYKIYDLECENEEINMETILEELGYYDDNEEIVNNEELENSEEEFYSD